MSSQQPERESLWSVGRKWLPWCLGLIFALTIARVTLTAWDEAAHGQHESAVTTGIAAVKEAAPAQPMIVVCAIFVTTILDLAGGLAVVTAKFLTDKFIEPRRERLRKQAMKEGYEQGLKQVREAMARQGAEWNGRREEAERNGVPFNEPPPGS